MQAPSDHDPQGEREELLILQCLLRSLQAELFAGGAGVPPGSINPYADQWGDDLEVIDHPDVREQRATSIRRCEVLMDRHIWRLGDPRQSEEARARALVRSAVRWHDPTTIDAVLDFIRGRLYTPAPRLRAGQSTVPAAESGTLDAETQAKLEKAFRDPRIGRQLREVYMHLPLNVDGDNLTSSTQLARKLRRCGAVSASTVRRRIDQLSEILGPEIVRVDRRGYRKTRDRLPRASIGAPTEHQS